jgi:acetyl/propionyl-CoA carboxylase alpha subunit
MTDIYFAGIEDREYQIEILSNREVLINGDLYEFDFQALRQHLSYSLLIKGESFEVNVYQENGEWEVLLRGKQYTVTVEDEREKRLREASGEAGIRLGAVSVLAPMPGLVIDIPVAEGEDIDEGDVLIVLESMKMQNELRAPRSGKISSIQTKINANVERKQTLLVLE